MLEDNQDFQNTAKAASTPKKLDGQSCVSNVVELDPILEAEAKYGPVFRRELFDAAYVAYSSIKDIGLEDRVVLKDGSKTRHLRTEVTLLDIYGQEHKVRVLADGNRVEHHGQQYVSKRMWMYSCIQELGSTYGEGRQCALLPYSFGTYDMEVNMDRCFEEKELTEKATVWIKDWQKSEMYQRLTAFLEEHAGKSVEHVDKIICFGLGCFPSKWEHNGKRSYTQHLAACTVRDILARQQGGAPPQIFTQEPIYCVASKSHVQKAFNMTVLDDPEGFKAVDGQTFVLSFAPNVPVRQVVCGLTHEFRGPAALFANDIQSKGLECNGMPCNDDQVMPFKTCEPSPVVWKYKQESIWMEYGDRDADDCFGDIGVYLKRKV